MNIIKEVNLFVGTITNNEYVYNDSVLMEKDYQRSFYGLSKKMDRLTHYSLIKYLLIIFFPFLLIVYLIFDLLKSIIRIILSKKVKLNDNNYLRFWDFLRFFSS